MPHRSVNKQILLGNLGADPEITYTSNGTARANFNVATTHKDQNKEKVTTWHRIVAWGRKAEIIGEYATKGTKVYIEGRTSHRKWEDKEGQTHWVHEVNVGPFDTLKMVGGRDGGKQNNNVHNRQQEAPPTPTPPAIEDDVPF